MSEATTYVGLDVHKKEISIAVLLPGVEKPLEWSCKNEPRAVRRLARRLKREGEGELRVVYEAGPCGYVLQRQFSSEGVRAEVIAPSLIPVKPGDRIKTDRRDARKLATLERGGQLTVVHPPSESEESVRDLCRCREDAVEDLRRARQRLVKMLLRRGFVYRSGNNWTRRHRVWLRSLEFEHEASQTVFDDYLSAIELLEQRMRGLETRIEEISVEEPYREPVGWLRCFRGIDTVSAMILVTELHGFDRFPDPRKLMAYLGLVSRVDESADRTHRGPITKAGNAHARRILIEAAWHYRHRPAVGRALRKRREGQPQKVCTVADKAQLRLHRRYLHFVLGSNKPAPKAVVAIARELVGFLWDVLYLYPRQQEGTGTN